MAESAAKASGPEGSLTVSSTVLLSVKKAGEHCPVSQRGWTYRRTERTNDPS